MSNGDSSPLFTTSGVTQPHLHPQGGCAAAGVGITENSPAPLIAGPVLPLDPGIVWGGVGWGREHLSVVHATIRQMRQLDFTSGEATLQLPSPSPRVVV